MGPSDRAFPGETPGRAVSPGVCAARSPQVALPRTWLVCWTLPPGRTCSLRTPLWLGRTSGRSSPRGQGRWRGVTRGCSILLGGKRCP